MPCELIRTTAAHQEHLATAQSSVLGKIKKIFDLPDSTIGRDGQGRYAILLDNSQRQRLLKETEAIFPRPQWRERCATCARFSGLDWDFEKQRELNTIARDGLGRYVAAFVLREALHRVPDFDLDDWHERRSDIFDIYINHITRSSLSEIKQLGFSDRSALSLAGGLIGELVGPIYREGMEDSAVQPLIGSANNDGQARANIEEISGYWQWIREILNQQNRVANSDKSWTR